MHQVIMCYKTHRILLSKTLPLFMGAPEVARTHRQSTNMMELLGRAKVRWIYCEETRYSWDIAQVEAPTETLSFIKWQGLFSLCPIPWCSRTDQAQQI
jgi:hypothetical protein